jgi:hypothetical protein
VLGVFYLCESVLLCSHSNSRAKRHPQHRNASSILVAWQLMAAQPRAAKSQHPTTHFAALYISLHPSLSAAAAPVSRRRPKAPTNTRACPLHHSELAAFLGMNSKSRERISPCVDAANYSPSVSTGSSAAVVPVRKLCLIRSAAMASFSSHQVT